MPRLTTGSRGTIQDPHTNRYLLLSVFVFGSLLLYLTTHRPPSLSKTPHSTPTPQSLRTKQSSTPLSHVPIQRPLVYEGGQKEIIKHRIVASNALSPSLSLSHLLPRADLDLWVEKTVGDIHGDYTALTKILRKAELIDLKGQWVGNETILVQTGDIVDRGKDTIACYRFMQGLRGDAEKKGGTVVSLLGNHEIVRSKPGSLLEEAQMDLRGTQLIENVAFFCQYR